MAAIPSATYSPCWSLDEPSKIIVVGTPGNTSAYWWARSCGLVKILDSDSTVWTPAIVEAVRYGALFAGTEPWSGSVDNYMLFKEALDEQEILDLMNDTTFRYTKRNEGLVVDLPMRAGEVSGSDTLDISGNALNATLSGSVLKIANQKGYSLTGGYLLTPDTGMGDSSFSLSCMFKATTFATNKYIASIATGGTPGSFSTGFYNVAGSLRAYVTDNVTSTAAIFANPVPGTLYHAIMTFDINTKLICLILNGKLVASATFTGGALDLTALYLGTRADVPGSLSLAGDIYTSKLYDKDLTLTQAVDLYRQVRRTFNDNS